METITAMKTSELEGARSQYYARLADHFLEQINLKSVHTILEAGSGKGQLTIPLLDRLPKRIRLVALDSSTGPYAGFFEVLMLKLSLGPHKNRVRPVRSDVRRIKAVATNSMDAVISNELLCDLKTEAQLVKAFKEFHRILRPKGHMIHGEWLSSPANKAQAMTIRADSPGATDTPSRFWNPDELSALAISVGFHNVEVSFFNSTLSLAYEPALKELRNWGVKESFLRQNDKLLRRHRIELPFEHVIQCQKPS